MIVKRRCETCGSKSRLRTVKEGYQVICIDNGHTASVCGSTKREAVLRWNVANTPVVHTRIRKRFASAPVVQSLSYSDVPIQSGYVNSLFGEVV